MIKANLIQKTTDTRADQQVRLIIHINRKQFWGKDFALSNTFRNSEKECPRFAPLYTKLLRTIPKHNIRTIIIGTPLNISFLNMVQWFTLSKASEETNIIPILCVKFYL